MYMPKFNIIVFFQEEDGIRDGHVTGVQTCALPISSDVQTLMQKVSIIPDAAFSDRFPDAMPAELTVTLENGTILKATRDSYEGFHDNPLTWDGARKKFDRLATPYANDELRDQIAEIVRNLEEHKVAELTGLLQHVGAER